MFSEVIVPSKCGVLAGIEKQAHKNWTYCKVSLKKEKHFCKRSIIKDQNSNYGIPLDLWKTSKISENFVSDPR